MQKRWPSLGLDLITLRLFVAVADEENLAKGARRENIAVSAASRRISEFEARAGVFLFDRRDRGMTLTAPGRRLREQLRGVFDQLELVATELEEVRGGTRGHVRIHAHMSAMATNLPELVARFLARHPGIDVVLAEQTSVEAIHAVQTGLADFGVISGNMPADDLCLRPWKHDELVVVLPNEHPLATSASLGLRDILDEPFVAMQAGSALLVLYREHAAVLGRKLRERAHATSFENVRRLVGLGFGVSILPRAAAVGPGIVARPLHEPWARRALVIATRAHTRPSRAAELVLKHLGDASRNEGRERDDDGTSTRET